MSQKGRSSRGVSPLPPPSIVDRETSPMPFERFDKVKASLNPGEYTVVHRNGPPYVPPTHHLRNALLLGGLGAGIGAAYHYRAPLMKLGQKVVNYATDKFHHLFTPTNTATNETVVSNPHNW